jgi:hypothetical protein
LYSAQINQLARPRPQVPHFQLGFMQGEYSVRENNNNDGATIMRILLGLLAAAIPAIALGQTVSSKTPYGTVPTTYDSKFTVSPDGQHLAVVKSSGSRRLVSIDGVDGEVFDSIELINGEVKASGIGMTMSSEVVFSPNGKRYAYGAKRGGESFVVVDGKTYPFGRGFIFSPDSSRFAYYTSDPAQGQLGAMVVDGVAGPQGNQFSNMMFSEDGKRFIYTAYINGVWNIVVDGKATPVPGGIQSLKMSPNGKRYGYATVADRAWIPVIDGVAYKSFSRADSLGEIELQISADGKRWAFTSITPNNTGYQYRAVIDGKAGPNYFRVKELQFSPDGKRVGYVAGVGTSTRDERQFLVLDGKKTGLEYRDIRVLRFSPDSRRYMAEGLTDAGSFVIVDGKESEALYQAAMDFRFSNSGRYTYTGRLKSQPREQLIIDGTPHTEITELTKNTLWFSPDGNRLIFGGTTKYPNTSSYLDGKIIDLPIMNNMGPVPWKQPAVFSPDSKHVVFMSDQGYPKLNIYLDGNPGVLGLTYSMPTFSADGKHFAVAGKQVKDKKWKVFVNGKAVTEVDDVIHENAGTWQFDTEGKLHVVAKNDKQFVRYTIDTQGSSLDSFTANMSKSGKTGDSAMNAGNKTPTLPGQSVATNNSSNPADQQMSELEQKQSEMQKKIEEMNQEAKKAADKKKKKLKEITDIFK